MQSISEPAPSSSAPIPARACAAQLLAEVLDRHRPFDGAFAHHAGTSALSARDRAFVHLLVLTVLRRLGQIDALLHLMLEKPLKGKSNVVMHCLRLGVAQLVWLKTPPHAGVHATVEAAEVLGLAPMKGLVNAVLKRAAKEGDALIARQDEARLNLPLWLWQSWAAAYGENAARDMARAGLDEPLLDLSVKEDAEGWARKLGGVLLPSGSVRLKDAGRVEELSGYAEGEWWVQDAAAALPAQLLGDVKGKTVLDLCAAPGGKTAQLASAGARVIAVDESVTRLKVLQENMKRLRLEVEVVTADVLAWKPDSAPDAILLDAPCSATGTLRRHPEVAWHRRPEDMKRLAKLQRSMLNRAAGWLKPGGQLVYCVCSLEPEEGDRQMESFLKTHPAFAPVAVKTLSQFAVTKGAIRTHPALLAAEGGMDGFYAICIERLNVP